MNQTRTPGVKQLGNGNRGAIPRLGDGRAGPATLLAAGERAMPNAADADAELRKSTPPSGKEKVPAKKKDCPSLGDWALIIGHGV